MLLAVGLGNPGSDYALNRHNIGFMCLDAIARRHAFSPFRAKFEGEIAEGRIGADRVLALKPLTYMNESGRSVAAAARFFKIAPEEVLVFHDELDLEAGRIRVKRGGGHAGHKGLKSIHAHLGPDYGRVRMGIGHPGDKERVTAHVLNDFAKSDRDWLEPLLGAVAENFALLAGGEDAEYMNRAALAVKRPEDNAKDSKDDGSGDNSG